MVSAPKHRPTMQQIAQLAGVSVTTVSHVLSGNRPVNPRTAERIMAIIRQSGYVPAPAARKLQSGRSGLIALVVPDIGQSYFGRIARGVELAADDADYGVIICSAVSGLAERGRRYLDLVRDRTVDGAICVASTFAGDRELRELAKDYPVVLADERLPLLTETSTVTTDNLEGGRLVGAHLAALGHTKAVLLAGVRELVSTTERVAGFRESFPDALAFYGDFTQESGARIADEVLRSGLEFTCIAAGNDEMAIGVIRVLTDAGRNVPADVSVVGFDDVQIAEVARLTTVRQPILELGARAARRLLAEIGDPDGPPVHELLPVELVVRASTAPVTQR